LKSATPDKRIWVLSFCVYILLIRWIFLSQKPPVGFWGRAILVRYLPAVFEAFFAILQSITLSVHLDDRATMS